MARIYACEIETYEISIGRSLIFHTNDSEFGTFWQRFIRLNLKPGRFGNGVRIAELAFYEGFTENGNSGSGKRIDSTVKILTSINDFDNIYKLLRTERPLFLFWQQNSSTDTTTLVPSWRLTTSREPIAEGDSEI